MQKTQHWDANKNENGNVNIEQKEKHTNEEINTIGVRIIETWHEWNNEQNKVNKKVIKIKIYLNKKS